MDDADRLADIVCDWRERRDRGEWVDPEEVIAAHPDLALRLRARFATLAAIDEVLGQSDVLTPVPPQRIGDYRIVRELGSGGMGTVHLAVADGPRAAAPSGTQVALKVLHTHLLSKPGSFKRFLREAELGKSVRHENVVRTLDVDAALMDGAQVSFLVLEYVEGRTLRDLLGELGQVPESLLREIARQVLAGLCALHAAGIVHRDLKPDNVLITDDRCVRIMDLGVARATVGRTTLTREGEFAGSLLYASPEQIEGGEIQAASDLYALGVALHELAAGSNPFRRDGAAAVIRAHLKESPPRLDEIVEDVSPFLAEVVDTLLAKDADARFCDAGTLLEILCEGERSSWWAERESHAAGSARGLPRIPVRRETKLRGRETDLQLLRTAWQSVRSGGSSVVLLEGEAGIGKTRLVDAFLREAVTDGADVLYGSYSPAGGPGALSEAVVTRFGAAGLAESIAPHLTDVGSLVPAFCAVLTGNLPPENTPALRGDTLQTVFSRLLQSLAAERPTIWVIEDLHFASADSRKLFVALARAARDHPAMILATTRPGLPEDTVTHLHHIPAFRRAALGRLSPREVIELLRDAFRSEALADKLGARIAYKSDGVPFFVFEMIRGLKEGQFITELPDGTWVETRIVNQIQVPSAVRDLIDARLRDLTRDERAMLDLGAVQGYVFDPDLIARVRGLRRMEVLETLAAIDRRSGVVRGHDGLCRFDHHQIQEVLYEDLMPGLRQEYHGTLAEALEARDVGDEATGALAAELCRHFLGARRTESARRYVIGALAQLIGTFQFEPAADLARDALAEPGLLEGAERVEALLHHERALDVLGRREDQRAALDEALMLADGIGAPRERARVRIRLGGVLVRLDAYEEAEAALDEAVDAALTVDETALAAAALGNLGNALGSRGRYEAARHALGRALDLAREAGDRRIVGNSLGGLAELDNRQGNFPRARDLNEQWLAVASETGDREGEALCLNNLGGVLVDLGNRGEARTMRQRALRLAEETGNRWVEAMVTGNIAAAQSDAGELETAIALDRRHLMLCREIGYRRGEAIALHNLAERHVVLGERDEAERTALLARSLASELGLTDLVGRSTATLGRCAERHGELTTAAQRYQQACDELRDAPARHVLAEMLVDLGRVSIALGRADQARAHLQEALEVAGDQSSRVVHVMATVHLVELDGRYATHAESLLEEHGETLDVFRRIEAHAVLARVTGDRDHMRAAREILDQVLARAPAESRARMVERDG